MVSASAPVTSRRRRALDEELRPSIELLRVQTNPIAIKTALNLLGHDVGGFRLPLVEATPARSAAVRGCLERLGLLHRLRPRRPHRARRCTRPMSDTLRIIPLGGLGEVGKNMTRVRARRASASSIDAGLAFPRDEHLGVDLVLPDFSLPRGPAAARDRAHPRARGPRRRAAVRPARGRGRGRSSRRGSRSAMVQVEARRARARRLDDADRGRPGRRRRCSSGRSGSSSSGWRTRSPTASPSSSRRAAGRVLHTGDWKLDHTPVDGLKTDVGKLAEIGNRGVDLMLGDSTNAERPGMTGSERLVGEAFRQLIPALPGPRPRSRASPRTSTACSRRPRSRSRTTARSRSSGARCGRT